MIGEERDERERGVAGVGAKFPLKLEFFLFASLFCAMEGVGATLNKKEVILPSPPQS